LNRIKLFLIVGQDAQANGYVASLKSSSETKMGLLHGAYGRNSTQLMTAPAK
jgi:hypothetical protein